MALCESVGGRAGVRPLYDRWSIERASTAVLRKMITL